MKKTVTFQVDPKIHKDSKAAALKQGLPLGKFIEEGMQLRLAQKAAK